MDPQLSSLGTIPKSTSAQIVGLYTAGFTWLVAGGFSILSASSTLMVITAVGTWGSLLLRLVRPGLIGSDDYPMWIAGPCLGFGALTLFALRLALPREIFLFTSLTVPAIVIAISVLKHYREKTRTATSSHFLDEIPRFVLALIAMTGLNLSLFWFWTTPLVAVSLLCLFALSYGSPQFRRLGWIALLLPTITIWYLSRLRPDTWWLGAEWLPSDETQLEAISNALIQFGPTTHPLWHGLDGLSAVSYHHLAYFVIGLCNQFSSAPPYEVLVNAAPAFISLSLVSSLLLLLRRVIFPMLRTSENSALLIFGLIACCIVVRLGNHPSLMFGFASVIASFVIVGTSLTNPASWRGAFLIFLSIITVSFSKGPLVLCTLCVALGLASTSFFERWRIAASALVATLATTLFFSFGSYIATPLRIEFWPSQNMSSQFELSIYSLKLFLNLVLAPVAVGLACALICIKTTVTLARQWVIALSFALIAGMLSQVFIASDATSGHEYFFRSAQIASALLVLLVIDSGNYGRAYPRHIAYLAIVVSLGITAIFNRYLSDTNSPSFTPLTMAAATAVLIISIEFVTRRIWHLSNSPSRSYAILLAALLLPIGVIYGHMRTNFDQLKNISTINADRDWSNWYGDPEMRELMRFLTLTTSSTDLLAISSCPLSLAEGDGCEPDYRLAAITGRRFLSMDIRFARDYVDDQTWFDYELSSSIGSRSPSKTVEDLSNRGATYLVLLKSSVPRAWQTETLKLPIEKLFENESYLVLRLAQISDSRPQLDG